MTLRGGGGIGTGTRWFSLMFLSRVAVLFDKCLVCLLVWSFAVFCEIELSK